MLLVDLQVQLPKSWRFVRGHPGISFLFQEGKHLGAGFFKSLILTGAADKMWFWHGFVQLRPSMLYIWSQLKEPKG